MNRHGISKTLNEYMLLLPEYHKIPKAVFAAIAISFAKRIDPDIWKDEIWAEWSALYTNRIIPQKPTRMVER